jgi:type III secretory pathway component EscU
MARRSTRSAGLFLLGQIFIIAGLGYGLSYTPISPQTLLWLIFVTVVWIGLLTVYVLIGAVDRVVELLETISKQLNMTPQKQEDGK